jgi:cell division protein FtsQ
MDRSFAARSPIGRLGRAPGTRRSRSEGTRFGPAAALRGALELAVRALSADRRLRLALIGLVVALPLLGGGWLWFRHSSFVGAQQVRVSGVSGPQAAAIEAALTDAAHGMSTLSPSESALRAAVVRFPQVSEVRAIGSFPHGMRIVVREQAPAAILIVSGLRTAVAGDGVALGPALAGSSLPSVGGAFVPPVGAHLQNPLLLEAMAVLGAAPHALGGLISRAYVGVRGLTVAMRNGLLVYFGDAERPHAKWFSLLSVLADPSSAGASYVDVRLPGRPAAGFGTAASAETQTISQTSTRGSSESTVSALAAGLKASNPQPATPPAESQSSSSGEPSSSSTTGAESSSAPTSEEAAQGASATPGG